MFSNFVQTAEKCGFLGCEGTRAKDDLVFLLLFRLDLEDEMGEKKRVTVFQVLDKGHFLCFPINISLL